MSTSRRRAAAWLAALALLTPLPALSADFTREQVVEQLAALPAGGRINLAGRSASGLDLSRLDFTGGNLHETDLSGANLSAAKFQDANLSGTNLSGASMGNMNVIRADLTYANLSGAWIFGLVTSSGMETSRQEAPIMVRANLSSARVVSRLGHADLTRANLSGAKMSADMKN